MVFLCKEYFQNLRRLNQKREFVFLSDSHIKYDNYNTLLDSKSKLMWLYHKTFKNLNMTGIIQVKHQIKLGTNIVIIIQKIIQVSHLNKIGIIMVINPVKSQRNT